MKKWLKIGIVSFVTLILLLVFYFFFPHIWGEAIYPLEYQDSIKKYSQQWGVRPNLVCAVIYTESHFSPRATSGVGAQGLMQIMPATGRSIAEELGEPFGNLYDPDTNIRYGTWYLKGLLEKFNGNAELAAAAYNAGVIRAHQYDEQRIPLPYETQFFIQKVRNAEVMYDKIYDSWYSQSESEKRNPIERGFSNIADFVKSLILGF